MEPLKLSGAARVTGFDGSRGSDEIECKPKRQGER